MPDNDKLAGQIHELAKEIHAQSKVLTECVTELRNTNQQSQELKSDVKDIYTKLNLIDKTQGKALLRIESLEDSRAEIKSIKNRVLAGLISSGIMGGVSMFALVKLWL